MISKAKIICAAAGFCGGLFIGVQVFAADLSGCSYNGMPLHGKVQVVTSFPDINVQVVDSFPDLKVKQVTSFPDACGEWQMVDSFPDFTVQFVDSFPDIKIQYVSSFLV